MLSALSVQLCGRVGVWACRGEEEGTGDVAGCFWVEGLNLPDPSRRDRTVSTVTNGCSLVPTVEFGYSIVYCQW